MGYSSGLRLQVVIVGAGFSAILVIVRPLHKSTDYPAPFDANNQSALKQQNHTEVGELHFTSI